MTLAKVDPLLDQIADYVVSQTIDSSLAYDTARWCLMDSLGCGFLALNYPACTKLLGPVVPGAELTGGVRVPGTDYELDPVTAAFNIGCMVRWLDFNDTWLAAEWGHPSDNLGAILACADYRDRVIKQRLTIRDVLTAMIKAHEIQGVLALDQSFNRIGLDHVFLVRVASAAVATHLLGGSYDQIRNAVSHAWLDGGALRTYRHAPNTGSRKSWAAGDATSRAVRLALIVLTDEMGYATPLSANHWGVSDVLFGGREIALCQSLGSYVMENVLFKISFPAEFHAQTAVEAAIALHSQVVDRIDDVERIEIETQESAIRIIDKTGPLRNPADRDHCLQYMAAIGLLHGALTADHYEDQAAADPRIDKLRDQMVITQRAQYSQDYLDPGKRSIANAMQVFFTDGGSTDRIEVEYPIGHRRRREEGIPVLREKFAANVQSCFNPRQAEEIVKLLNLGEELDEISVNDFMQQLRRPALLD